MSNRLTWHLVYFTFIYAILIVGLAALTGYQWFMWMFGAWIPYAAVAIRSHYTKSRDENVERFKHLEFLTMGKNDRDDDIDNKKEEGLNP